MIAIVASAIVISAVVFSLGPAWRLSQPELAMALKPSAPLEARRRGGFPLTGALVATQIALSVTLIVTAGVFIRAAVRAASSEPGFPLAGGLVAEMDAALAGIAVAAAVSAIATIAASYLPARRALRVDPAVALRPE